MTGGTGYIGGSVLALMIERGYLDRFDVSVLVRRQPMAERLARMGVTPVLGDLDSLDLLAEESAKADVVFNMANCDHVDSAVYILHVQARRYLDTGVRPLLIHTSGAGVLTSASKGTGLPPSEEPEAAIWDDADTARHLAIPPAAPHRLVDLKVLAAADEGIVRGVLVVPPTVFGRGVGPLAEHRLSIQIPRLIYRALTSGQARFVGQGENVWPNVHVADLADLYLRALDAWLSDAAIWDGFRLLYPVTEHFRWGDVAQRIARELNAEQLLPTAQASSGLASGWFWGSNVQMVSSNGRSLGWTPRHGGTQAMLAGVSDDLTLLLDVIAPRQPA